MKRGGAAAPENATAAVARWNSSEAEPTHGGTIKQQSRLGGKQILGQ